jgi:hypothetical protein
MRGSLAAIADDRDLLRPKKRGVDVVYGQDSSVAHPQFSFHVWHPIDGVVE